jgi:peroxiredoxin
MKPLLRTLILLLLINAPVQAHEGEHATIGQPAPPFTAQDTNGKAHSLSDYKGKIVVLEWTNPQCPYVKKHYESGNMQALQKQAAADGVVWLTVASSAKDREGYTTPEEANKLIADTGAAASARLMDADGKIGMMYDAKVTPHMFVIGTDGNLAYAGAIDDNPSADPATVKTAKNYVAQAIEELRAGKPVSMPLTQAYGCGIKYDGSSAG